MSSSKMMDAMPKNELFIKYLNTVMVKSTSFARIPDQAEDFSPRLYSEKIPII